MSAALSPSHLVTGGVCVWLVRWGDYCNPTDVRFAVLADAHLAKVAVLDLQAQGFSAAMFPACYLTQLPGER